MTGDDHVLARDLAGQAGQRLLELRAQGGDPDVLRKAGDRLSHEFLTAALAACGPATSCSPRRAPTTPPGCGARRVWIVDPLDGTREYGEPGRTDWAVHVALWEARAGLTAGRGRASRPGPGPEHRRAAAAPADVTPRPVRPAAADRGQPDPAAGVRGASRRGHGRDADAARLGRGRPPR